MRIILSTVLIFLLKVATFTRTLKFVDEKFPERTFFICCIFFFLRCLIFKQTEDQEINSTNHGDFLSEFPSLTIFYFFYPNFKTALYFHLSLGSLHYLQYFAFLISNAMELTWRGIKTFFARRKKAIPRVDPEPLKTQPSPSLQSPPIEQEVIQEERPTPLEMAPKKRPSIYDI